MMFFPAILALVVVSLLMVRAMGIEGFKPATAPRAPRVKAPRVQAGTRLDAAALRGLY